ncbi:hypothetical protein AB1K89_06160 [Sporosarcina sp. 179-K 8C2 HS]|uniref:hypothetical protein n=1 Tax=Sporosarcina sp. 179-K 8C2 HS TaxID=3142387 RepID=UPI0039A15792
MKLKYIYLLPTLFFLLLAIGCSNKQVVEQTNDKDDYGNVRAAAWEFINEKG